MIDLKKQRLLIIAPHPDDEVIGCGGLIQKVKEEGGGVFVLFLTVGDTEDFSKNGKSTGSQREKEIEKVAKFLRFDNYHLAFKGEEYHLKLDTLGQLALMNTIERESPVSIEKVKPTIVALPSFTSYNQDHRAASLAAHAALRASDGKFFVKNVISFESPADFWSLSEKPSTNFYIPLDRKKFQNKVKSLKLYKSQWRQFPSSRSQRMLEALAALRGGQASSIFAEAFVLNRAVL